MVKKAAGVLAAVCLLAGACARKSNLPAVGSAQYGDLCGAFYLGLAGLQSGEDVNARKGLTRATEIAPGEPAGWLNLGLLQFRQQDYEGAFTSVQKAEQLTPDNSRIEALLGVVESRRGHIPETLAHLKKAVALDANNLKAEYALAQETERQNSPDADAEAQKLLERILQVQPNNLAVLVDLVRLSAKRNDAAQLRRAVTTLQGESASWPVPAKQQLQALAAQANSGAPRSAAVQAQFLRNVLVRVPAYRQSLDEVRTPVTTAGEPFLKFLKLPSPRSEPDPPDTSLRFEAKTALPAHSGRTAWAGAIALDADSNPVSAWADGSKLHLSTGAEIPLASDAIPIHGVVGADLNYDFKTDLVLATERGLKIYRQQDRQHFTDVTGLTKLPPGIVDGHYTGVWAFDVDLDGDLDLILGVASGEPVVLRNNGDDTFMPIHPFRGVDGLLDFASADVDGDGDADVALLDKGGQLRVLINERLGDYRARELPSGVAAGVAALAAGDVNGDGVPDFVVLHTDGRVFRLSDQTSGREWNFGEICRTNSPPGPNPTVILADLDNNGALDVVIKSSIYLGNGKQLFKLENELPGQAFAAADLDGNGRLDLLTIGGVRFFNSGTKPYHWQTLRTKAAQTSGDQRMNSFGIGGEMEIRADLLTEKQIITSPVLHFGTGSHEGADFARIVWPNGIIQTEFALKPNQTVLAEQRLKGSCPFLFAWDGREMKFVKDVAPMSGAVGAHDPTGRFADVEQTEEWFTIPGEQLKPRDGYYDLRITDEYWETYYMDQYSLMVVDHADGTEIHADERVAVPPVPQRVYATAEARPFEAATDESGADVSAPVRDEDGKFLGSFRRDTYRGIARDHSVELTLPRDAPAKGPVYLLASGWLHPWDDSTLVAVSQSDRPKPDELSIEVQNASGKWVTARANLGVPAGRFKTAVIDLSELFLPGAERRFRLRTNLEIYWDKLAWATAAPSIAIETKRLLPYTAELNHRGFSQVVQANPSSPEVPLYGQVTNTGDNWPSLEGYYTRYGDVLRLIETRDDRYVIARSGDELRLRFREATPVRPGWRRDFVLVGDGWMKEGDYSFRYSTTVQPLPYHAKKEYAGALLPLEDEPAFRQHASDWQIFHTRYVAVQR